MDIDSKKTAVTYCRVSTDEQAKEGLSIDTQEKVCNEHLVKDGYVPLPTLKDEGKSGKDMNRPAMRELIRLINEKKIQAVYVVHSDRIGRNLKDYLVFKELLRKQDVVLNCIYQPMLDDSATGRTMDSMMMAFSEMQRLITSEKVQGVMREIAKAGYFPTYPPAGYYNARNPNPSFTRIGRNILAIDPVMGPLITDCFHRYARGDVNVYELSDIMYAKGLRNQQGHRVLSTSMYSLLRNRIYLGEIHWGGIHVKEGKHEALIDEETFDRVQKTLEDKNKRGCRRRKYDWLLKGLVVCPTHGNRYCAEWHMGKKNIAYYHCSNPKGCGKYIEQTLLEGMVADKFRDLNFSDEFISMVIEKAQRIFMDRRKTYDARRQGYINRRSALDNRRKTAEDKLLKGVLSDEDFTRISSDIQKDITQIDDELLLLEDQRGVSVDVAQEVLLITKDIHKAYKKASPDLKRKYLLFFWDHFEVQNGIIISSHPALLFDAISKFEAVYYRTSEDAKPQDIAQTNGSIVSPFQSAHLDSNQGQTP